MSFDNPKSNLVVFNTRQYTGNFERDMCAFVIGRAGYFGEGAQYVAEARATLAHLEWYDENIYPVEDDEGCEHIVTIIQEHPFHGVLFFVWAKALRYTGLSSQTTGTPYAQALTHPGPGCLAPIFGNGI